MEVLGEDNIEYELASFRQQWREELVFGSVSSKTNDSPEKVEDTIEQKACQLYKQGVQHEAERELSAAVYFYRQAVKLVPDIEFRFHEKHSISRGPSPNEGQVSKEKDYDQTESLQLDELQGSFDAFSLAGGPCSIITQHNGFHISSLPTELLLLIVRWVVSTDLDIMSLEQFSLTCKWFYVCARDAEIWKAICMRVWGVHCTLVPHLYSNSWRKMFFLRPRVKYDGLYISTNTYVRIGEQSLNSFYKPCHLVEFYKYLRFFPNGLVLLYTSADEPMTTVQMLHRPPYRDPTIYRGYYRLVGTNLVNIYYMRLNGHSKPMHAPYDGRRRRNQPYTGEIKEQQFSMQLTLVDHKNQRNCKLLWESYTYRIKNRKTGETSDGDIGSNSFRPFVFSSVKSYSSQSNSPL